MEVSVVLITYNQEAYIKQSIESVIEQITDFDYELLICNDCSSDNTIDVINEFQQYKKNHLSISIIDRANNMGASMNLLDGMARSKGKYIIILEGDDYWISPNKLQILYNYLENHPEYFGVSHRRVRKQDGIAVGYDPEDKLSNTVVSIVEYGSGDEISAMSTMFRNIYADKYFEYKQLFSGARNACDLVLCFNILLNGNVFVLDDVLGVYRVSSGNNYCNTMNRLRATEDYIMQCKCLLNHYGNKLEIRERLHYFQLRKIKYLLQEKEFKNSFKYICEIGTKGCIQVMVKAVKVLISKRKAR